MPTRTPLTLLHGWAMTPEVWRTPDAALATALATRYDVLTPPLPGHAGTPAAPAATLAAWRDALLPQLPTQSVLCGWSLGALLALDIARHHPQRVARLILIGATARFVAGPDWPHGLDADTVAAFRTGHANAPDATQRRFLALQALGDAWRKPVLQALTASCTDANAAAPALADGLHILEETDLRATVSEIRQPTLLLHGANDALMPAGAAHWLATVLPAARLHLFEDCGHAPFLSRPQDCAQLINAFANE